MLHIISSFDCSMQHGKSGADSSIKRRLFSQFYVIISVGKKTAAAAT